MSITLQELSKKVNIELIEEELEVKAMREISEIARRKTFFIDLITTWKMKFIFVCSPFQGKKENVEKAKKYCRMLVDMGYIPIAPHVYFSQFMDDKNPEDRRKALEMNKKILEFCDELWIFGDEITEGMREEIEYFKKIKGENKIRRVKL